MGINLRWDFLGGGVRKVGIVIVPFKSNTLRIFVLNLSAHQHSKEVIWKMECTVGGQCLISLRAQACFTSLKNKGQNNCLNF